MFPMLKFFRNIRRKLLSDNRVGRYLIYAVGEIALVVIGILIALQINNWNENRLLQKKEIEILKAFDLQFQDDYKIFDECLAFYGKAENSIDVLLHHLENGLPYHDSLSAHFFASTRIYVGADMAKNVFESLKSAGTGLVSNKDIRSRIVLLYEEEDPWIRKFESMYVDFLMRAGEVLFPTRFVDFWQGDHTNPEIVGIMVPLNFDQLKDDQEYLYFLKTQRNHMGWLIKKPIEDTRSKMIALQEDIRKEIDLLENR